MPETCILSCNAIKLKKYILEYYDIIIIFKRVNFEKFSFLNNFYLVN